MAATRAMSPPASHHDVVHQGGIEPVALPQRRQRLGGKIERGHLMQRAVGLAAPPRRADVIVDEGVGHDALRS
jgi:hypothetical protein